MFTEAFMVRAFLAALLLAPACALLGVFVTARRMAFFSDTIAHGALAGIALGFWWGMADPTLPMVAFSLAVAVAIVWLRERTELLTDTIMALLLSGSVAFGVLLLSVLKGFRGELHRYLFGDILAVGPRDVLLAAVLLAVIGVGLVGQLNRLILLTAHEEMAHVCGIGVRRLNLAFVVVVTLAVALSIRLLGIILVTSLLVIPPAAARNLSRNLRQQIVLSLLLGLASGTLGTVLSYQLDVPCGPAIVLTSIALFGLTLIGRAAPRRAAEARPEDPGRAPPQPLPPPPTTAA
jgi:ABC-type Mn2+/Zn2+ transport system permease subunit